VFTPPLLRVELDCRRRGDRGHWGGDRLKHFERNKGKLPGEPKRVGRCAAHHSRAAGKRSSLFGFSRQQVPRLGGSLPALLTKTISNAIVKGESMSFRTLPRLDHASRRGQMGRRSMPDLSADSAGLEWTILPGELKRVAGITHTVTGKRKPIGFFGFQVAKHLGLAAACPHYSRTIPRFPS